MMTTSNRTWWHQRRVLGWRVEALALILAGVFLALWGTWLTREVVQLQERRIVSVSLQTLVEAYVMKNAREGTSEEDARRRTKAYLQAVEAAIASLDDGQTIVLVSEAVVGRTVPDVTPTIEAAIARETLGDKGDAN